jgi:hypothetical protein
MALREGVWRGELFEKSEMGMRGKRVVISDLLEVVL